MDYSQIVQSLLDQELLTVADIEDVRAENVTNLANLFSAVVGKGKVTDEKWAETIAQIYGLPFVAEIGSVEQDLLQKVPSSLAFKRMALPLRKENGSVIVAVTDPEPEQIYEDVRILTGGRVRVEIAPENILLQAIQKNYGATVERLAADLGGEAEEKDSDSNELEIDHDIGDLREAAGEPTVVNLVNLIIFEAIRDGASDIHIEPFENEMKLRYRLDGILIEQAPPPKHLRLAITSRIKIMAGMNIAERFIPQDGHIKLSVEGRSIDLRVSCCPTVFGESVVMRILDKGSLVLDVEQLGMSEVDQKKFDDVIHRPHGIFLVTGPTGSGKTTTLYTALTR
ncbi:MAG: Flp pilus assembly complex ATPase component TadA, partial [Candidatus Omnitrophica bacterium]|nr:Flp pilus assembly complex ATPase component TadA [Candidatus Omnitrophota bacterium]